MTVSVGNGRSQVWNADGTNRVWSFPFKVLSASHVRLEVTTPDGITSTIDGGFSVSNLGANDGGTVTYPVAGDPLPNGTKVQIVRRVPYAQPNRIGNQGGFHAKTHEDTFDLLVMQIQQVDSEVAELQSVVLGDVEQQVRKITNPISARLTSAEGSLSDIQSTYPAKMFDLTDALVPMYNNTGEAADGLAKRLLRGDHAGNHSGISHSTLHVEANPNGSGINGPASADFGLSVRLNKSGWAGAAPVVGEVDGLNIVVRQSGPQPTNNDGASDATGILINAQSRGNVGFTAAIENTTSSIDRDTFALTRSIQTQIGVIDPFGGNSADRYTTVNPRSYGFAAMSRAGANTTAFYAAHDGGTWNEAFRVVKTERTFSIDMDGRITIGAAASQFTIRNNSAALSILNTAGSAEMLRLDQAGYLTVPGQMTAGAYKVGANQVIGARVTGFTAFTGTADFGAFNADQTVTISPTYNQSEMQAVRDLVLYGRKRIAALETALRQHGLIN